MSRPLHCVLVAKRGAPNGCAQQDKFASGVEWQTCREKAWVNACVTTIEGRELALCNVQVQPHLASCVGKPAEGGFDAPAEQTSSK